MSKSKKLNPKVSYHRKPDGMSIEDWQIALRRQFAEKQDFKVKNIGGQSVFSDFQVYNPISDKEYKVAIRSYEFGENYCSCPDFRRNELGTCKHIEFVLLQLKNNPKNEKYWKSSYIRPYSSISLKYGKERKVLLRIGSVEEDAIRKLASDYFDNDNFLLKNKYFDIIDFISDVRKLDVDFKIYNDALEFIIDERAKLIREETISSVFDNGINSSAFKSLIKADLYPYQKEGILKAAKAGRVIIADDMGLGKTIQAIAVAEILAKEFKISNVLIVCPTSLKYQWKSEIKKFTTRSVTVIEGVLDKRKPQYNSESFYKIASYGVGLNDVDYLNKADFDLVILDEAQRIKNWKTKTAKGLKQLDTQYAIVLTGTPLENRLAELHSIVEFVNPYKLGALFRFLDNHEIKDAESGKVIGYHKLNDIKSVLDDVLIRRTKKEIINQLPERIDKNYFVDITKEQKDIHQDYETIVNRIVHKWRRLGFLPEKDRQRLMISMACMRMVSDSTYILDQKTRHDKKIDELVVLLKEIFESSDDKVVIFSQWERMTRLVGRELKSMNIDFEYLHGGVPSAKRKDLIDNFRDIDTKRVFLSTDAGGVGLNLQSANVIINLDLPWNPAVLEQRIARVHRLGQQKMVRVINFISKGTIENRILSLINFKKSIFEGVLDGGEDRVIMDESKFNKLMKSVEQLNSEEIAEYDESDNTLSKNKQTSNQVFNTEGKKTDSPLKTRKVDNTEELKLSKNKNTNSTDTKPEIAELFTTGAAFFEKIGETFSKMQTGEINISDFIDKNKETGQTSIKIPVENEEVVVNTMKNLANIFSAFSNK